MRLDVYFTPGEVAAGDISDRVAVVIDVLRATSTMVEALANGARGVFPAATIDDAVRVVQNLGRETALLCGERRCLPVEGFDLGNSPAEFTAERVASKLLVMTTTNGTQAVLASNGAREILIASFLNLEAVASELAAADDDVAIVCAGRERRFALEDAVCAGALADRLRARLGRRYHGNDAADAARTLARRRGGELETLFRHTAAGRQLVEAGLEADLAACAAIDRHAIVPRVRDRQVVLEP